jgi:hypothetical protein
MCYPERDMAKGKQTKPSTTTPPQGPAESVSAPSAPPASSTGGELPTHAPSPYDRPPEGGKGAGVFLLVIALLISTAIVVGMLQGQ